jgi:hypothetical protein
LTTFSSPVRGYNAAARSAATDVAKALHLGGDITRLLPYTMDRFTNPVTGLSVTDSRPIDHRSRACRSTLPLPSLEWSCLGLRDWRRVTRLACSGDVEPDRKGDIETDVHTLHRPAVELFIDRVSAVQDDQWGCFDTLHRVDRTRPAQSPDVRESVTVPLIEGVTLEEVGDRFAGDLLGADPIGRALAAATAAITSVAT